MDERIGATKSRIEGPRWLRIDKIIKNACWELGLECEIERDVTVLTETVRLEVKGTESKLRSFKKYLETVLRAYNDE